MKKKQQIGIIGGMGPEATADIYLNIIKYYQAQYGAKYDADFPPMIIYSLPVPDVVEVLSDENETKRLLIKAAETLEKDGCDFIIIACNTVQFLLEEIRVVISVPVLGIAEICRQSIKDRNFRKIGILATAATIDKKIYQREFQKNEIAIIAPSASDQKIISKIIMRQLAGKTTVSDLRMLEDIILNLKNQNCEAALVACTDLPNLTRKIKTNLPLLDCSQIYAQEAAKISYNN